MTQQTGLPMTACHDPATAGDVRCSIVIPHKNTPAWLERLLASIPLRADIEVIVIDDKSAADMSAYRLAPAFPHVTFVQNHGPAHNAGAARNIGLHLAQGEWVIFADADDLFCDGMFDALMSHLMLRTNDDIVFFGVDSRNEAAGSFAPSKRHVIYADLLNKYQDENDETGIRFEHCVPWGKAIKRTLITSHDIKFDSVLKSNDVMFSFFCGLHAKNISVFAIPVYSVTESGVSLTATINDAKALAALDVLARRNLAVIRNRIACRTDWGLSWFLKSRPWQMRRSKLPIYMTYFQSLALKLLTARTMRAALSKRRHALPAGADHG